MQDVVTGWYLVRDPIRDMLGGYKRKFTFVRINFKFRTWNEKSNSLHTMYWHTGEGAVLKVVVYDKI